jgi:hypothetical protein
MMKLLFSFAIVMSMALLACSNAEKKHNAHKKNEPKTRADSLMADVMEGHDAVMPKMGKIRGAQKEAQRLIDSIGALPEKAKAEAAALKARLEELVKELGYADFSMDKWMTEFNMDSAKENTEARIQYLLDEKMKVGKVKDAIINSLNKADSLLKKKF